MAPLKLLVTGGAGFIGSDLVRVLLRDRPRIHLVNLDLLTYAGDLRNLDEVMDHPRHTFVQGDICDGPMVRELMEEVDGVVHLAAETHVDRSIQAPGPFLRTNVLGTGTLLEAALAAGVTRFVQVSTDEVYGQLPWSDPEARTAPAGDPFREEDPLSPRSPYAASKAAGDLLTLSFFHTFGLDVVVARGSNCYGPRQNREKLIPRALTRALGEKPIPLYGDGLHVREWMFVTDFCRGIVAALEQGRAGAVYNFAGGAEKTNLQVIRGLLEALGRDEAAIEFVSDRPGHDRRYALDCSRAVEELGWEPQADFQVELARTAKWYQARTPSHGVR